MLKLFLFAGLPHGIVNESGSVSYNETDSDLSR